MTPAQRNIILRLINAERAHRRTNGEAPRWIKVGMADNVAPYSAARLVYLGIVEQDGDRLYLGAIDPLAKVGE